MPHRAWRSAHKEALAYPAVQALFALVLAAVTGEEAEAVQRRFRRARDEV